MSVNHRSKNDSSVVKKPGDLTMRESKASVTDHGTHCITGPAMMPHTEHLCPDAQSVSSSNPGATGLKSTEVPVSQKTRRWKKCSRINSIRETGPLCATHEFWIR